MSELPVISIQGLSKRYVIGHETRHDTFRDRIANGVRGLFRRRAAAQASEEEFWALRDVSFDVKRGEVVGIIGRNGAGKSTLLKILSRITEPTTGRVSLRGRVASLLEVGTGFHPELTGRENIFLNGAILGMQRAEIRKKFDEIVAFAEVERFLDTPVKRYSSGMYVRLAFAVAAHLEPEILIVDEVLAVGDQQFQDKCLGKIRSIASSEGRTVLFVSHQTDSIRSLCSRVVWLADGKVRRDGPSEDVVNTYLQSGRAADFHAVRGKKGTRILHAAVTPTPEGDMEVDIRFEADADLDAPHVGFVIRNSDQRPVMGTNTRMSPPSVTATSARRQRALARLPAPPLHSDSYTLSVYLDERDDHLLTVENILSFEWIAATPVRHRPPLRDIGPLLLPVDWRLSNL
ncbi:MAG: ABC transporter ATP-binding protein [Burkholderiales bacterium]|nr:ABC transporter ATP-binding protein [Opitutaceae bacterium]